MCRCMCSVLGVVGEGQEGLVGRCKVLVLL